MAKAIYPGSFDPITFGHVDIIRRIESLFSEITVVIANSHHKEYMFSSEERLQMVKDCLPQSSRVNVVVSDGLTVDYARGSGADVIIRGIRAIADFEYEMAMANMNKKLGPGVETLIVFASPEYNYVSSRMVKEVARHGGDLANLVPPAVGAALSRQFRQNSP